MKEELRKDFVEHTTPYANRRTSILIEERKQDPKSYWMLLLYMLFISSYGYNVLYVQPIARSMKKAFDVKDSDLSILLSVGSISSSVFFLPLIYVVVMRGVKVACLVGLGLLTIGTFLELFIDQSWALIYIGHTITHAGSPVFNIANAKFASIWFNPKTRPLAITLNAMMSTVGILMAFLIPGLFVNANSNLTPEGVQSQVKNFHYFLLALYGTLFILCLVFFQEAPARYITYRQEEAAIRMNFKMFSQIWELVQEPTYIYFVVVIGVGVASVMINQLLIVQLMSPYQFSQNTCQIAGAIMVLGGVVGSIGYTKLLIQKPNQLRKLKVLYMLILMAYTVFSYLPTFKKTYLLFIACFTLGFFGMTQVSIAIESLIKYIIITGPQRIVIGSGVVQVILSMANGAFSFILRDFLMENSPEGVAKINITIFCTLTIAFILSLALQVSFERRINAIVKKSDVPSLLPALTIKTKDDLVASLAANKD